MGIVNFLTDVNKTVQIDKNVNLDVFKNVTSNVELFGSLATAEASADAIGGDGGGGGGGTPPQFGAFLIDDFDEPQNVFDLGSTAGGMMGTVQLPNPADTDIPDDAFRTLYVETLSPGSDSEADVQLLNPGELTVNVGSSAFANAWDQYTSSAGAFDITPLVDNAQILANAADGVPDDFVNFTIDIFNAGNSNVAGVDATARISVIFEDDDGDLALSSAVLAEDFNTPITIPGVLATFINDALAAPAGTPIPGSGGAILFLGTEDDADGDGNVDGGVDFDAITSITLIVEDRPGQSVGLPGGIQTTDFFAFNDAVEERESVSGTDLELDLLEVRTFLPGTPGEGLLAEVDTFAQVEPGGAFAFSESLAAADYFDFG